MHLSQTCKSDTWHHFTPCNTRRLKIKVCILFTETANTRVPHPALVNLYVHTCQSGTNGIFKTATHCIEQLTRGGFEKHGEKLPRKVVGSHACSEDPKIHIQDSTDDVQNGPSASNQSVRITYPIW